MFIYRGYTIGVMWCYYDRIWYASNGSHGMHGFATEGAVMRAIDKYLDK